MKKIYLFLIVICSFALSANAQNVSGKCYRGFADLGYTIGLGDYKMGRFEINTSHGYQFSPYFFLGAGVGFHFMPEYETPGMSIALDQRDSSVEIPIFANLRANFTKTKVAPFVDAKVGTYVTNGSGLYASITAGCRIATTQKQGVNLSIGYTYAKYEFQTFDHFTSSSSMNYTRDGRVLATEGLSIKVGYEF